MITRKTEPAETIHKSADELKVLDEVRAGLSGDPRLDRPFSIDRLRLDADGVLIFEAEVDSVAKKKIALERAAAHPQVAAIVDRIRVRPASHMGDAEVRAHLRRVYTQDPALAGLEVIERRGKVRETVSPAPQSRGYLDYEVVDGIVTLNGSVAGLATKRYVGVLAWWVPGSRDVINGIVVQSDEADGADKIAEAVRLVLEKDPYVDASQVKVGARNTIVRLTGVLASSEQREMAENDAWYVFGVDDVVNEITVAE